MIDYKYYEYDGMDPGLEAMEYDGADYALDDFGERIGPEGTEYAQDPADEALADDLAESSPAEDGFRESIQPENVDSQDDQLSDQELRDATASDSSEEEAGKPVR